MVAFALEGTPAGVTISNRAEATYEDDSGTMYGVVSSTVSLTIMAVPALAVTPDDTAPSDTVSPNERVSRLFRICNTGNVSSSYTITRAEVNSPATVADFYFDKDSSGTLTDADVVVRVNETISPAVNPAACIGVLAVIDTNEIPSNSDLTIRLSARSTVDGANGKPEDDGTIINRVGAGARLTSPDGTGPPLKTVNGSAQITASPGAPFTYTIALRNSGGIPARAVVMTDELSSKLEYVPGSLNLDNQNLTDEPDADAGSVQGRRVVVQLGEIAVDQVVNISFKARLVGSPPGGVGVINFALFTGQNIAPTTSATATVVIDPFGIVFSGRGGGAAAIPNAEVAILLDQAGSNKLPTPPGVGFPPNTQNDNPFATDSVGHFSFALLPAQLGTQTSPARYFMRVSAQGYSTRVLEITTRVSNGGLFTLNIHALDGQPLAIAGGFDLVREDVNIEDMASVALNIPMFEPYGLGLVKSADRQRAEIGDAIAYRLEINNPTAAAISDLVVHDRLPFSFNYATGTGRLMLGSGLERPIEPQIVGDELVFRIEQLGPGTTARLSYRVRIGANAREGAQENVAVAAGVFPSGERSQSSPARATVTVGGGIFSTRQVVLGRVFVDSNHNDEFDDGDKPLPGVRLFLNSGQSVVTDSQGLYNFPSLGDGPQVISLDPITLPQRHSLADGGSISGRSWTRLLRTPLGGGALLRQNFALVSGNDGSRSPLPLTSATDSRTGSTANGTGSAGPGENAKLGNIVKASLAPREPREVKSPASGEFVTTETLEPVLPGDVKVLKPAPNEVVMSPAMQLDARVALNWTVKLEVNGKLISEKSIGTSRLDKKNIVATYTFVGIDLRPGANRVRATAISPQGTAGRQVELTVLGRGPARRLEIVTERGEIQANGRDSATLRVRAFDEWGNPAADDQVALETSAGELLREDARNGESESNAETSRAIASLKEQKTGPQSSVIVALSGGEATLKLIAAGSPGEARLHAQLGQHEALAKVRIVPELRPTILVGLAEVSIGQSIPEVNLRGEQGNYRSRFSFFFSGRVLKNNLLTLAYDSQRPINRTAGRDRLFQLDPLDRVYPLFGDSSTRYEAAQSNSKLYARLDHNRSYAMFGDLESDMEGLALTGYSRQLTGVKLHLENSEGDFVTVTGARPDTSFARDVFPAGGLGLLRLSHGEILQGSEAVVLEVRDRRNPEIIISREILARSIDYNLNPITGEIFFLRYISTFDFNLNLIQLVVTYEHRASSLATAVYTTRARKNFAGMGLQLGFAGVMQRQEDSGAFSLAGFDGEKSLPNKGTLRFAYARSQGEIMGSGNFFQPGTIEHNGNAYLLELNQPLSFYSGVVRARYAYASVGFFNPFGATVTPGSRRGEVAIELKPRASSLLHFGVTDERNHTNLVSNRRLTLSAAWDEMLNERIRLHLGYDHRSLDDDVATRTTESNLITAGAEIKLTDKLQVAVKREQNLGEADPTFPDQTTIGATYQVNQWAKIFLSQRFAAAAIMPIGDFSTAGGGFASSGARRETAVGVETRLGKYSSLTGSYQLENGISGTDGFAVIGLQNRLPITKELSLELGFERGFHLAGEGESFNSATVGFGWQPMSDFRASARYEFRDRAGNGQLFSLGAAGRIRQGITALARFQVARTGFEGRDGSSIEGMAALAIRPLKSDRVGVLFSFTHRSLTQNGGTGISSVPTRDQIDSLSTDGYFQATKRLEVYTRFALRFNANGQADQPFVSTLTLLTQERLQYRLSRRFDWAGELRFLMQPSSNTRRAIYGTELGFWALPDLRFGLGYNFNAANEPTHVSPLPARRGFYFTISSKLSNLFDLFGTSRSGLAGSESNNGTALPTRQEKEGEKK